MNHEATIATLNMQLDNCAKDLYEKDKRIAELERQLAEASAPAIEKQPVGYTCQYDLDCLANYNNATIFPVFDEDISPIALYAAPLAADTDKVREAAFADTSEVPYLIFYDDQDKPTETVIGHDRAAYRFQQISGNWNAHLYVKIASNSRDCKWPNAKLATDMAAQAPVREVPEGWKLVPAEPTDAMLEAIEDAAKAECSIEWDSQLGGNLHFGDPSRVYADMLAAAPLPAAPVQQEGASNA